MAIGRIFSKAVIDMNTGMPQIPECPGRHVFQIRTVRQQQEDFEQCRGMIYKNIVIDNIDQAVYVIEPFVDLVGLIGFGKQPGTHVLKQDHVQLHDRMRGAIVLLHHVFAGTTGIKRLAVFPEIESFGNRNLDIEKQFVFTSLCLDMQTDTDVLESLFRFFQLLCLGRRQKPATGQLVP